jgi:single-strand DNA-binding protein
MPNYNHLELMGHIVRETSLKESQAGKPYMNNCIAVNDYVGGDEQHKTSFVDFTAFGKTAEAINKFLNKGSPVLLIGRIDQQKWETEDGDSRSKLCMIVNKMVLVGSKSDSKDEDVGY